MRYGVREPPTDHKVSVHGFFWCVFFYKVFFGFCQNGFSLQVTTSIEQQATESSLCERNTTAGLSTQGKSCGASSVVAAAADAIRLIFSFGGQCIADGV